ncbi:Uncharacterised protein [Zhongshania aliphaticivorans]|uniref:Flagellar protein FlaG n=1 Tax=Zhongshania aliphaticivorans TaxID=1470434 RepID=A0A5S9P571_9GAMM|nr:flagellar protein FlaG [Zhongshania aliphaticivorans]CAA0090817.1 Uncharacterised protein [Zhongshania aliphaticivorans]CAA0098312.1 Uncharacterised protein [Zhongshania aliphaticivorans]
MDTNLSIQTSATGSVSSLASVGKISQGVGVASAIVSGSSKGNLLPQSTESGNNLPLTAKQDGSAVSLSSDSPGGELSRMAMALVTELGSSENIERTEQAVAKLNEILKDRERDLEFSVDQDTGRTILKVIHAESGEVIRQLPPEELLNIAKAFIEGTGSLIDDQA